MIKFIDISDVLNEETHAFVFYNAETHHFLSFFNRKIWHSFQDFNNFLQHEKEKDSELQIDNYRKLLPTTYL